MFIRTCTVAAMMAVASLAVQADSIRFDSGATRVHLLELFTSEGCSSCPPAEKWVNELKSDPRLWRELVPVAFHVDYWDYIGWPDRFASPEFSERQREYARRGYIKSVYTPGLVVGGEEWRSWFYFPRLKLAKGKAVGPLRIEITGGQARADYIPASPTSKSVELNIALLGFDLETAVEAGENRGRTLEHDFVVLGFKRVTLERDGDRLSALTELPRPKIEAGRTAVAAWVSARGDPFPVQAVGGWLVP